MSQKKRIALMFPMAGVILVALIEIAGPALWLYIFLLDMARSEMFSFKHMDPTADLLLSVAQILSVFSILAWVALIFMYKRGDKRNDM